MSAAEGEVAAGEKSGQTLVVGGHRIRFTNLGKVLYPSTGTTKGEVLAYYASVATHLIAHAQWRPATRKRWVDGVGTVDEPGKSFFQKQLENDAPAWIKRFPIEHGDHVNLYPVVNNTETLLWLAQRASLEIHVTQWQFGPRGKRKNPDRLVLDLDPGPGAGLAECAHVAHLARESLRQLGLECVPVTSGSKGIQLYAGLPGEQSSDEISSIAHELARALESEHPDLVVSDMKKSLRQGKVLIDWSQNNGSKTTITPYSLRGRELPTVAAPRSWDELGDQLEHLTLDQIAPRLAELGDPFDVVESAFAPTKAAEQSGSQDRLSTYRAKRDGTRTPEPIPSHTGMSRKGSSFVIQEHHASRLHYDFRLEHDGVLVSWAVPKGVPTDPRKNHLAVQTEDHPLEYAKFEGTIPKGEYGGGTVKIWDAGSCVIEKWREGEEIIATLHGRTHGGLGGVRTFALIHTGKSDPKQWLIHLMNPKQETH